MMTAARTTMKSLFDSTDTVPTSRIVQQLGWQPEPWIDVWLDGASTARQFLPVLNVLQCRSYNVVHRPTVRQKLSRCNKSSSVATELQRLGSSAVFQTRVNRCSVCISKRRMNGIGWFKNDARELRAKVNWYKSASSTQRQDRLGQSSDKWGDRRLGGNDGMGNGECGLICLIWHI